MQYPRITALALAITATFAAPLNRAGNIVSDISDSYDFVVVGGGLAGLVLGARLSQDGDHTVLVLEAGSDGSDYEQQIETPGYAYYGNLWDTAINWAYYTVPQTELNGYRMQWPRGKVLGGSSAINGMYLTRPSSVELDAWNTMLQGVDGADNWSWDTLYAAMKTSESFTPPSAAIANEADITWNPSSHGYSGPIDSTWPGYTFPIIRDWCEACQNAGVAYSQDTYSGNNWGAYVAASSIDPSTWTRSTSKTGYLDSLPARSNYDVFPNAFVTRVLFAKGGGRGLTADAVQYTTDGGSTLSTVKVNKEVILAGGTIGSPTILMQSGIGPSDVLSAAGVDVLEDLPGVGEHLMDHLSVQMLWSSNQETAGAAYNGGSASPEVLSYVNDAVAFVNSGTLFGGRASAFQASVLANLEQYAPSAEASVVAGYNAIGQMTAKTIFPSESGLVEILLENTSDNGTVFIQVTLQHPYSQGRIWITSDNPMDYPSIDPMYLTNPADQQITIEGLKLARKICQTAPLSSVLTELTPGDSVQSDAEWLEWMRGNVFTEFHPASTCAMLPRNQGGVVDGNLLVYGTRNVRVADASVHPIMVSAHLQSSTYGIAEIASSIIRAQNR